MHKKANHKLIGFFVHDIQLDRIIRHVYDLNLYYLSYFFSARTLSTKKSTILGTVAS